MADTYTTSLRLQQPTVGADSNTWGTILNTDWTLVDNAIAGLASVSLTGLTTYTLTANNGASDQARNAVYDFTGSLSAGCLVTLPAVSKLVWAIDATTGGQTVTLTPGIVPGVPPPPNPVIYYTTDGSFPGSGNPNAVIYTAPFTVPNPTVVRWAEYAAGFQGSAVGKGTVPASSTLT